MNETEKKKVMVGLSGGVDSAVAAYLLIQQGYEVVGGFMRNWDAIANGDFLGNPTLNENQCPQEKDYDDACAVAEKLGISLLRIDFVKEYWDYVFKYFLDEYKLGRTPNPDIFCNKYIKFDKFLKFALDNGCDMIATGHYAKRVELQDGRVEMHKCFDQNKDQTYFLSQVSQDQLKMCLFPLDSIDKPEVRRIAGELGLTSVAKKKDSTGVCFIGERNFKQFLNNYLPAKHGDIIDVITGEVVGHHEGVLYYTFGQRRGLGIGGIHGIDPVSWFVVAKNVQKNQLFVAQGDENDYLLSDTCYVKMINWIGEKHPEGPIDIGVKFRYRQPDHPATLEFVSDDMVKLTYADFKAVTPGQAAVFYDGENCLGGGIIDSVYHRGEQKRLYDYEYHQ